MYTFSKGPLSYSKVLYIYDCIIQMKKSTHNFIRSYAQLPPLGSHGVRMVMSGTAESCDSANAKCRKGRTWRVRKRSNLRSRCVTKYSHVATHIDLMKWIRCHGFICRDSCLRPAWFDGTYICIVFIVCADRIFVPYLSRVTQQSNADRSHSDGRVLILLAIHAWRVTSQ